MVWKCLAITFSSSHIDKVFVKYLQKNFTYCPSFDCFQGCYNIISNVHIYHSWKSCQQCGHSLLKYKESALTLFLATQLLFYNCSFLTILYINKNVCGTNLKKVWITWKKRLRKSLFYNCGFIMWFEQEYMLFQLAK